MKGTLTGTFFQLYEAGCIQTGADVITDAEEAYKKIGEMLYALMEITGNNPCEECPALDGGNCAAYQKYHTAPASKKIITNEKIREATTPKNLEDFPGMTTKQIAEQLGVSKNEVRRMKARNLIK